MLAWALLLCVGGAMMWLCMYWPNVLVASVGGVMMWLCIYWWSGPFISLPVFKQGTPLGAAEAACSVHQQLCTTGCW